MRLHFFVKLLKYQSHAKYYLLVQVLNIMCVTYFCDVITSARPAK